MKPKVSKTMAKYINSFVKKNKLAENAEFAYVGPADYPGGTFFNPDAEDDYDCVRDKYQVIRINYPSEHYACPCVISTPMLKKAVGGRTLGTEEFDEILRKWIEI